MNPGQGDKSYCSNSIVQRSNIHKTKQILEESVRILCSTMTPKTINIADLGCSSGPNALLPSNIIIEAVRNNYYQLEKPMPEFHIFLNDLPENDFNTLFKITQTLLQKLRAENEGDSGSYFVSGSPGSFYGRLFPTESLHFVNSSHSLQWLSKVPPNINGKMGYLNKGNIALGKTSPSGVFEIYLEQFQADFQDFLRLRSQEIVPKGCMVLSFLGRNTIDPFDEECFFTWDTLAEVLRDMVEEGIVKEEDMNSFRMPYFQPHKEEVRKLIEEEGSFDIIHLAENVSELQSVTGNPHRVLANCMRAVMEPMVCRHFGTAIVDELFQKLEDKLPYASNKQSIIALSLCRKG